MSTAPAAPAARGAPVTRRASCSPTSATRWARSPRSWGSRRSSAAPPRSPAPTETGTGTSRLTGVERSSAPDDLEGGTGDLLQSIQVLVVPAAVRSPADIPVRAVVRDDQPVAL